MTKMTDTAAAAAIGAATRELRLPVVRTDAARLAEIAQRTQQSYLAFLAEVLSAEVDERVERRRQRRVTRSPLPPHQTPRRLRPRRRPHHQPRHDRHPRRRRLPRRRRTRRAARRLAAPARATSSSVSGIAACEQGRRVRYATAAQLVNELAEAADERRLSRIVARYGRLDLLCLDELGYVQLDARGSELLFQILTEREEKASVAVASNLPFSEWGTVIPDPRLVAAIVDRRHLQRPHHRDRHQQLPPAHHPHPNPPQEHLNQPNPGHPQPAEGRRRWIEVRA